MSEGCGLDVARPWPQVYIEGRPIGAPRPRFGQAATGREQVKMSLKTAKQLVEQGVLTAIVDFGVETDRAIKSLTKALEFIKDHLREEALEIVAHTGEKNAKILGTVGSVTIAFAASKPKAKKKVDLLAAEQTMAPELWATFFRKVVTVEIAEDAEARLAALEPAQQAAISQLIEIDRPNPSVTFK